MNDVSTQDWWDNHFMSLALQEALVAYEEKEVPVGAVLVGDNHQVLGKSHNQVEHLHDPTAHAEMLCITQATQALEQWRLEGTVLYTTLEPCPMCLGAIHLARIQRVVYGAQDSKKGACGGWCDLLAQPGLNHYPKIESGLLSDKSEQLLKSFFKDCRRRT